MTASLPPTPPPAGEPDWEDIARLVAGELSASDAVAVRAKVNADPVLARFVRTVESAEFRTAYPSSADVDAAVRRARARMHASPRPTLTRFLMPIAAAIVAAAGITWFAMQKPDAGTSAIASTSQVFRTTTGERDSITLSDGSKVVLGPGSELTLAPDFSQTRSVTLKGHARFDVVHDEKRLFTVHTAQAVITDLGTVFTINDFDGAAVDVSVQSGSVRLAPSSRADSGIILKAGDAGEINARGVVAREERTAAEDHDAWLAGKLVFREAPMVRVRAELRRWYGVELVMGDSAIAAGHLTATFRDESLPQMVEIIALALGAKHQVRGDTVVLQAAGR